MTVKQFHAYQEMLNRRRPDFGECPLLHRLTRQIERDEATADARYDRREDERLNPEVAG